MTAGDKLYSDEYLQVKMRQEEEFLRKPQAVAGAGDAFSYFFVRVEGDAHVLASEDFFSQPAKDRREVAARVEKFCHNVSTDA